MTKNKGINWNFKHFSELSTHELYALAKIRMEVFIIEQNCHYLDLDNLDLDAYHVFAIEDNQIIAYARLLAKGVSYPQISIGRVLVDKSARGRSLGHDLMTKTMDFSVKTYGPNPIKISAQEHLTKFYEAHKFKIVSEMYLEDDIPHVGMLYTAE